MKAKLFFVFTFIFTFTTFAQVQISGFLQKRSYAPTCMNAKELHYLETVDENISLDFSKWKSLMDIRGYYRQPVVLTGVWRYPQADCKYFEVKELHFDLTNPDKYKAVSFQELKGYKLLYNDKNPYNDFLLIFSQAELNRHFAPMDKMPSVNFNDNFVVGIVRSAKQAESISKMRMVMREKDKIVKLSYLTMPGSPALSEGICTFALYLVDKADYKALIFEENGDEVYMTERHWNIYEQPSKNEKPFAYTEAKGYSILPHQRKDGVFMVMAQTAKQFGETFGTANTKDKKTDLNFATDFVVAFGKTSPKRTDVSLQDVTIEGKTIRIHYIAEPSNTNMSFPSYASKIMVMKKVPFEEIILIENGKEVGKISREFNELRFIQ